MVEFITANWLWIALIVGMVLMHRGGGCGSHGSHAGHTKATPADEPRSDRTGRDHGSHP